MSANVLVETKDRIARIEIARIDKKNALTGAMYDAMREAITASNSDCGIRVLFIHGTPGCFTAGNDLAEFQDLARMIRERPAMKFLEVISTASKPIVIAAAGPAVGIGTTMLLHADLASKRDVVYFRDFPVPSATIAPRAAAPAAMARVANHGSAWASDGVWRAPSQGPASCVIVWVGCELFFQPLDTLGNHTHRRRFIALTPVDSRQIQSETGFCGNHQLEMRDRRFQLVDPDQRLCQPES